METKLLHIFFFLQLLFFSYSHGAVQDFCIADFTAPISPEGYSCKNPKYVTVDDFVFTGLRKRGNTKNILGAKVTFAFVDEFPGFNGLGLAMARIDLDPGGAIPIHTHPGGSEVIHVVEGALVAGFIALDNTAYYKLLQVGDLMIFPKGLLHFQVNIGKVPAMAFVSLNSASPGIQITADAFFSRNFPTEYIMKTALIGKDEVERLKELLGGKSLLDG